MNRIIGNNAPPSTIDRTLVDKLNEEARRNKNQTKPSAARIADMDEEYLTLTDIQCIGADGTVFEQYDRLLVAKRVTDREYEAGDAIAHFERSGRSFLPSFALTCNILAALYRDRQEPEAEKVLRQYVENRLTSCHDDGLYAMNTVVITRGVINHYPRYRDDRREYNLGKRFAARFPDDMDRENCHLTHACNDEKQYRFLKDLTGLEAPELLKEIGAYVGKNIFLSMPFRETEKEYEIHHVWFGSIRGREDYLHIDMARTGGRGPARGVIRAEGQP